MSNIEVIVALLLLFRVVPDACPKLQRPALTCSVFELFGLLPGPLVNPEMATMPHQGDKPAQCCS